MVRTYCRFWIRMKDSTIDAGVGSPSLNLLGIMFGGYEYRCAGVSRVAGGKLLAYFKEMHFLGIHTESSCLLRG